MTRCTVTLTALLVTAAGVAEASQPRDPSCRDLVVSLARQAVEQNLASMPRASVPPADEEQALDDVFARVATGRAAAPEPELPTAAGAEVARPQSRSRRAEKKADTRGPKRYTKTNTQELDVDEGDIVKTNGRFLYHLTSENRGGPSTLKKELRIYSSWPVAKPKLVGRYLVPAHLAPGGIEQLYLLDGAIAMIGRANAAHGARGAAEGQRIGTGHIALHRNVVARVLVLDVREPASPRLVRHVDLDGSFVQSRLIGSRLYLASASGALGLPVALHTDIRETTARLANQGTEAILADLGERWDAGTIDIGLPRVREVLANVESRPIYTCSDLVYDGAQAHAQLLNLVHIDLSQATPTTGAGMNGYTGSSHLYASEGAFYVASPTHVNGPASFIRKFALGRAGKPKYAAQGTVPGQLLNQFAMSEYEGRLRVATSVDWQNNGVYVLEQSDDGLVQVGAVSGLARGERIFAVRMMGAKGYVVTFRRTDPLYTLDLSNPRAPRVVGELKVEGFSTYLHPLDDGHLLTVGQDADARGRSTGFHLQIFDVRDMSRPRRVHHEKLDAYSTSTSQSDHHAFMFEPATKTLAIPWKGTNYWGLVAYRVDAQRGFTSLGRVNHALMYKRHFRAACRGSEQTECGDRNYWWRFFGAHDLEVDRVVAIDGHLFSMSRSGLMVHAVGRKLRQRASVLVNTPAWQPADRTVAATGPRW